MPDSEKNPKEEEPVKSTEILPEKAPEAPQEDFGKILPTVIEDEMKSSYLDYAMSVIVSRALPDVRDGLKPVHRRILFAMKELGMLHNKPFKKSARVVGEVLGKYHPHGDSAVYDTLVRMAQTFSLRYPLINGQGNFGSVDGDSAAAMRYTECRLAKISEELLIDIDKKTVDFQDNFDGSLQEPSVLPAKIPNLLINGASGIAVGMATNIPPHNMDEVCSAAIALIDNPDIEPEELMSIMKGPDFPTGGIIQGTTGIKLAYKNGRGRIKVKAKTVVEERLGKRRIIVEELPYMVNKSALVQDIADLVREKKIIGISDLRDESDRKGMRIVIELKKDANLDVVQNQLLKHTRMMVTFGIIMIALVNNEPKVLNLTELLSHFISHRKEVTIRRIEFDLKQAEDKAHILEGLIIALDDIDKVITKIKASKDAESAKNLLMDDYSLTEVQAKAILEMRLQKLASLEQEKIRQEHKGLLELIAKLKKILSSDAEIFKIIKDELKEMMDRYGDSRKTEIEEIEHEEIDVEDLIKKEDMVVTITHSGYAKRVPLSVYKQQNRGGKGIIGAGTGDEDFIEHLFVASTHTYILFFTNKGIVHWLKVYKIPETSRQARGKALVNLVNMPSEETISAFVRVDEFDDKHFLLLATKKGIIKKTNLIQYSRPRLGGIIGITLDDDDELIEAKLTDGTKEIFLATRHGMAVRCSEKDARPIGRTSRGVRGVNLRKGDRAIGMVVPENGDTILTVTENGYGKRTKVDDYRLINRGGLGVINIQTTDRNGKAVEVKNVSDEDEIMLMSKNGIIIRTPTKGISVIGRNTQGVRLMNIKPGDQVVAAAKVVRE